LLQECPTILLVLLVIAAGKPNVYNEVMLVLLHITIAKLHITVVLLQH